MKGKFIWILFLVPFFVTAQNYTSYITGNTTDLITSAQGGICLMGGATENDEAMKWFLNKSNGGDILILRTSGADGYNNYMYSGLGVAVNSVETIVCNNINASNESYVKQKIQQAEAIWFAGGDQWTYISYWRNTAVDSLINEGIKSRHLVIGGTSAGMAIQGKFYFTAENGTITSGAALSNPYNTDITVDSLSFIKNQFLNDVITDTHYDNPDRKGRHITFMARILTNYMINPKGIACDEYTAVCIDTLGIAHVYGGFPAYDDNAYFIQSNCEVSGNIPENCETNQPLSWNQGGNAIKVYTVKGTANGANTFNLNNWQSGIGGTWQNWSVNNGVLQTVADTVPDCSTLNFNSWPKTNTNIVIYPNPTQLNFITIDLANYEAENIIVSNLLGQTIIEKQISGNKKKITLEISDLTNDIYFITIKSKAGYFVEKIIINN